MFKVTPLKNGKYCVETNQPQESISDFTGTTTFIYCDMGDLKELHGVLWPEIMEVDMKGVKDAV